VPREKLQSTSSCCKAELNILIDLTDKKKRARLASVAHPWAARASAFPAEIHTARVRPLRAVLLIDASEPSKAVRVAVLSRRSCVKYKLSAGPCCNRGQVTPAMLVVVALALALGPVAAPVALDMTHRHFFVAKTHFSTTNRAVFVAGLEGSRHHGVDRMIATINRAMRTEHVEVVPETVQALMYRGGGENAMGAFLMAQNEKQQPLAKIAEDRVSRVKFTTHASMQAATQECSTQKKHRGHLPCQMCVQRVLPSLLECGCLAGRQAGRQASGLAGRD
jgi:hypothetical protein